MMKNKHYYTLITGASSGLGKELSVQCASLGMNLILVALPGRGLHDIASQLARIYRVDVKAFELDLTNDDDLHRLVREVEDRPLNFLINNAGIGGSASFTTASVQSIDTILRLNIRVTSLLTRLLAPVLLKQEQSFILNISSMSAFSPIGFKTVYPASKAFIYSFSMGLREEFRQTGLSVSASYPGPMLTNSNTARRIIEQGYKGKLGLLPVSEIARIAIRQTLKRKAVIIPGLANRFSYALMSMIPSSVKIKMLSGIIRKEIHFAQPA